MKRTPLRRRTPLRAKVTRRAPMRSRKTKHALRDRAPAAWQDWIHAQPCFVRWLVSQPSFTASEQMMAKLKLDVRDLTLCVGGVEADHMGSKMRDGGDGEMAADRTCVSMCHGHHQERHAFTGTFKHYVQEDMRAFLAAGIAWMHARAEAQGVEIPEC